MRVAIPADLRAQWGKREEIVSLHTGDEAEAIERGAPIYADIMRRIRALRSPAEPAVPPEAFPARRLRPEDAYQIIQAWRHAEIDRAYADAFDPVGEPEPRGDASALSHLRHNLSDHQKVAGIADFDDRLATLLNRPADSAVIRQPNVREWFRMAWLDVEQYRDRFVVQNFNGWPEGGEAVTEVAPPIAAKPVMKLSDLRDQWNAVKPLDPRQTGYIRRLIEHLGDRDIGSITSTDMDGFLIELRRFPLSRKPCDDKLAFGDLIARYDGTVQPRLHVKTIWNWTVTYKGLFAFAVSRRLIDFNPAADMMKKPSAEEANDRKPYSDADLDVIFTRPMFSGFDGRADVGYRENAGSQVVKDTKYWLPILALHSGMRLEELASLRMAEVIDADGVVAFDLTGRPLKGERSVKNRSARRIVPLHKRLHDLGFVEWMRGQKDFVFPDLAADPKGKRGSQFSKWWGFWSRNNAEVEGAGIDDPSLTFHSFRHSWKRAARMSPVKEEVHDLLSGHSEGNTVARGYGRGVDLATLKAAMDEIEIGWP